jgi:hypothetical protein
LDCRAVTRRAWSQRGAALTDAWPGSIFLLDVLGQKLGSGFLRSSEINHETFSTSSVAQKECLQIIQDGNHAPGHCFRNARLQLDISSLQVDLIPRQPLYLSGSRHPT